MRVFVVALALSLALTAVPSYAQAPAPAPAGQGQKPAVPPAAQAPAPQAAPARPRVPFQAGLKYGYVNLQEVAQTSNEGKALNAKVVALNDQKVKELQGRQKALATAQEKLEKGGTVMNDQARAQLQADIEKQQRDIQRFTEDAQQELTALQQQLQVEFERRLTPVLDSVARAKEVHFIFNATESGLVWADPSMDLTPDVIAALDAGAGAKPAAAAAPAAPPAK